MGPKAMRFKLPMLGLTGGGIIELMPPDHESTGTHALMPTRAGPTIRIVIRVLPFLMVIGVLFLLNASRPGRHPEGCPLACSEGRERSPGPLRVVSLNMFHGHPDFENLDTRLNLIAQEIQRLDPDFVLLQEIPWRWGIGNGAEFLAQKTGLNYLYLRANGNRWTILFEEGEAILSRYPLREPSSSELKPKAAFFEHRVVLHAIAETDQGDIDLYVTHLTDGADEINHAQADALRSYVGSTASGPAIVAGDFNAKENESHIQTIAAIWSDAYRIANPNDDGFTCCVDDLTQEENEPLEKRIDYIFFVSGDLVELQPVAARRVFDHPHQIPSGWQWVSNHVGVMIEFVLKAH